MSNKNKKVSSEPARLKQNVSTPLNVRAIVLSTIGVILTVVVCVIIAYEQLYEPTLLTVNDTKYHLTDLRYYIFNSEYQGYQMENFYKSMQSSYWDQVVDEKTGQTNLEKAKEDCLNNIIQSEILYQQALKEGYTVSDEDTKSAQSTISEMKENLDSSILKENGFTSSYLSDKLEALQMVSRFQQDKIDSFDIDDQAIKDGIKYEDYHEYELGVFTVAKTETNEDGETVDKDQEKVKKAVSKLEGLKDKIKDAEDLSKILDEKETFITYTSKTIKADDTTYGKKNTKKIIKMKNGDIMDVFETDTAYYLVKMVNNKATASYDSAVQQAITSEETEQFEKYYEKLEKEAKVKENTKEWDKLDYGNITFAAYQA